MTVLLANNATSRLASSLTAAATTLAVTTGQGARFPSPSGDQWFPLTLAKADGTLEIVKCTARSGDVFTVVRAQEGTAAQSFSAGDRAELRITAAAIAEFRQNSSISQFMQGMLDDADAAAARQTLELGSAALSTPTESPTDSTAGRLTKVGDYGWGGLSIPDGNANAPKVPGVYSLNSALNAPFAALNMLSTDWGADPRWQAQLALGISANRAFFRSIMKDQSGATDWAEFFHTSNVSSFIQMLFDDADAAAARETLGALDATDIDFTIIYPNGGSAASPANVAVNSRYVSNNPFPGHFVFCEAEVLYNGVWGSAGWSTTYSSGWYTRGVVAHQLNGDSIITQTGITALTDGAGAIGGSPIPGIVETASPRPCRVKVWKVKGATA